MSPECVICKNSFVPRRKVDKTCSMDCQVAHRRALSRERARRHYVPRAPRPDTQCESCAIIVPAPKTGPMPRWCKTCRANLEDVRGRARISVRRCYKCQVELPEAARKPGKAVCDGCRVDRRDRGRDYEHRRRLRTYGLTQDDYDQLLTDQDHRCPGCGTDDPGWKGWSIDHCHSSGKVRALLCMRCNTMIGLAYEDPRILRSVADLVERFSEIKI